MSDDKPHVTRSGNENGTRIFHVCESELQRELQLLLERAYLQGFVIEVQIVPMKPLAMGNYRMVGHVRPQGAR